MLTSITPLGERGRRQRWWVTVSAYGVGCLLGGATTGTLLGGLGALLPTLPVLALAGVLLVLAGLVDLVVGDRLPGGHRQVDEDWLTRYRGWVYGAGFGYQLGLGVVTVVTSAATWAVLALAMLTQSVLGGLLVGAAFGAVRAVPTLALGRARSHAQLRSVAAALERRAAAFARLTAALLVAAGGVLLAGSVL